MKQLYSMIYGRFNPGRFKLLRFVFLRPKQGELSSKAKVNEAYPRQYFHVFDVYQAVYRSFHQEFYR